MTNKFEKRPVQERMHNKRVGRELAMQYLFQGIITGEKQTVVGDIRVLFQIIFKTGTGKNGNTVIDLHGFPVRERTGGYAIHHGVPAFTGTANSNDSAKIHDSNLSFECLLSSF